MLAIVVSTANAAELILNEVDWIRYLLFAIKIPLGSKFGSWDARPDPRYPEGVK